VVETGLTGHKNTPHRCATIGIKTGVRMFVVVWQFEIAEDKIAGFEAAYGPDGAWAKLFRSSPDYRGTELLRDAYIPGAYLTIDRWSSEDAFRAFRKAHDADYETLDRTCDALTSRETRIGAYTV
jgi:heme-degrading monooxygenase HmoA